jgi:ppGpp synthetase/RelA/SpoT-type nucleotidyltranferase
MTDERRLTEADIEAVVARYRRERGRYEAVANTVYEHCLRLVRSEGIQATVHWRAKSPESLQKKLLRFQRAATPDPRFTNVDDVFRNLSDLAGVRIATYLEADRDRAVQAIEAAFALARPSDRKDQQGHGQHYRATHCQVVLRFPQGEASDAPDQANLDEPSCEIQVCSMLAQVWNELAHDIGYQPESGEPDEAELDNLELLGRLVRSGDHAIQALVTAHEDRLRSSKDDDAPFGSDLDFALRMQPYFPITTEFSRHSAQLFDALLAFQIDSPKRIREAILGPGDDYKARGKLLIGEFSAYLATSNDKVLTIDPSTSDILAVLFLDKLYRAFLDRHPTGRGMGRPPRLVSLAARFDWKRGAGHR